MELSASGEDYLEAVLILSQRMGQVRAINVAQYLGYAKTSVSHGLQLLRQGGFLTRDREGHLYLTETGQKAAEEIYAKHRFLLNGLLAQELTQKPPREMPAVWSILSAKTAFAS